MLPLIDLNVPLPVTSRSATRMVDFAETDVLRERGRRFT